MLTILSFLIVIFVKITNQIQFSSQPVISPNNETQNRQQFYSSPQQFQITFQYRPDFGGPWQNVQWQQQRPIYPTSNYNLQQVGFHKRPTSSIKPVTGIGSATPVSFPGPVNDNVYSKTNGTNFGGSGESVMPTQNENRYEIIVPSKSSVLIF